MTRTLRVFTNETCDLRCEFCDRRREHERPELAGGPALRRRLLEALEARADTLVLTGGEPTLRRDLPQLVSWIRRRTDATLVLETHGGHLDVDALHDLDVVRVHLPAWGERLDAFTGRAGTGAAVQQTLQRLADAPVALETATPIVAANLGEVATLPVALATLGVRPQRLWFGIPTASPVPDSLAPLTQATAAAARFVRAARRTELPVALDPAAFVPPCTFEHPAALAHVFALNRGAATRDGFTHADACERCSVRERCPGIPRGLEHHARTLASSALRRRLTVIGTPEAQIQRELVTHEAYRRPDGTSVPAAIVRTNFRCNQSCTFCFVSTHLPDPPEEDVRAAIDAIAAKQGSVAFSGGEPTLNPRLPEYVRYAKAAGVAEVELQTNATRMAKDDLAATLADSGVDRAFVSLHGLDAQTSDRVTEAPGTFEQTVAGIDALARTAIALRLNFVLCQRNYEQFPDFVRMVAERWPAAEVNVSFVAPSTDLVPRTRALIPRYEDVLPHVADGMRVGEAAGVTVDGFESMCGIPLCLVPGDLQRFIPFSDAVHGASVEEFVKPAGCASCVLQTRCFGLRRGYAELYGTEALRPVLDRTPPTDPS
ncbi:MAG: radical SAM protein [Nannocystaceae bacterium]|nr:radical SAM protein [bacterium]